MKFSEKNAHYLREFNDRLTRATSLRLLKTADRRSRQFEEFGLALAQLAPKVRLSVAEGPADELPALLPGESWRYHLVPEGAEFRPFFELIAMIARKQADLPPPVVRLAASVPRPARVKIYVTNFCPHCRNRVTRLVPLPLINPLIQVVVIDGMLFPELARKDKIRAVPTVICDEHLRWTGPLEPVELLEAMLRPNPAELGSEMVRRMIREGASGALADMMLEANAVSPAFLEMLVNPEWSLRLGAMVVFEDIVARNPNLAAASLEPIWRSIRAADENVKGDMIYLIGIAGTGEWIPRLKQFRSPSFSKELNAIVTEAVANLQDRNPALSQKTV